MFFVVFFLVSFGDFAGGIFCAFSGGFSTVFWCFFPCIFRACPFSFLYLFPLGGGPVFCRAFFGGFWVLFPCFFPCFFSCFFSVFFLCLLSCFFSCIFSFFLVLFFVFFFRALGGTQDKQPQYFAFWPVRFLVLFLVVTTSEDRIYTIYILIIILHIPIKIVDSINSSNQHLLHLDCHLMMQERI